MKKKSIAMRLGVFALALTLVTASLSSGTLAKYASKANVNGKLIVATWTPTAAITDTAGDPLTQQASDVVNLRDTLKSGTIVNDKALSNDVIAPGTIGSFKVKVDGNGSQVGIKYSIKMYRTDSNSNDMPVNLKFWKGQEADGSNSSAVVHLNDAKDAASAVKIGQDGTIDAGESGSSAQRTETIWWEWPYTAADDADDVQDSNAGTFTFTVLVEMTQVNPNEPAAG